MDATILNILKTGCSMQIDLFCVGKQDRNFLSLVQFYKQRIQHFSEINIYELEVKNIKDEVKRNQLENEKLIDLIKKRQKSRYINLWACDPTGQAFSSEQIATRISQKIDSGQALGFLIGGSMGLNQKTLEMCSQKISFSNMTFPHQLFRVILLEQIYRGLSIISGVPYHKA